MNPNSFLPTLDVLARLKAELPAVWPVAKVVGHWIWLEFDAKPDDQTRAALLALGFHWNRKRVAWQHPCGKFSRHAPYDPREKYLTVSADEMIAA